MNRTDFRLKIIFCCIFLLLLCFLMLIIYRLGSMYIGGMSEEPMYRSSLKDFCYYILCGTGISITLGILFSLLITWKVKAKFCLLLCFVTLVLVFFSFAEIVVTGNHLNVYDLIREHGFPHSSIPENLDAHDRGLWVFWKDQNIDPQQYIKEGFLSGARTFQWTLLSIFSSCSLFSYIFTSWIRHLWLKSPI